jgi:hypothetical protein
MSGTWFHDKAEEESRMWLQIAAAEERQEERRKKASGREI